MLFGQRHQYTWRKKNLSVYNRTQTHDTPTVTCAVVRPSQISCTATSDQKLLWSFRKITIVVKLVKNQNNDVEWWQFYDTFLFGHKTALTWNTSQP